MMRDPEYNRNQVMKYSSQMLPKKAVSAGYFMKIMLHPIRMMACRKQITAS